ncbi:MAG TPA: hypothetical protein VKH42_06280 [Vicinamibacterales bacterium]|nr:hypothetical protein [Vicinamibacterales bacterium]
MPSRLAAAFAIALTAIACGGNPPDKEITQAQAAIEAARGAGADQYAKTEYAAAQDALKRSVDAVADRDYRLALNHALDARERAEAAARQAVDGKVIARADADRAVRDLTAALSEARARLKSAESAHVAPRIVGESRRAIAGAETAVQKARTAIEAGDYTSATALIAETAAQLRAATHDLEVAQSAPARRRQ